MQSPVLWAKALTGDLLSGHCSKPVRKLCSCWWSRCRYVGRKRFLLLTYLICFGSVTNTGVFTSCELCLGATSNLQENLMRKKIPSIVIVSAVTYGVAAPKTCACPRNRRQQQFHRLRAKHRPRRRQRPAWGAAGNRRNVRHRPVHPVLLGRGRHSSAVTSSRD